MADTSDGGGTELDALERVAQIARELASAGSLDVTLQRTVDLAEAYIAPCDGATIMFVGPGGDISTPASSSRLAYLADRAQMEVDEGPCLSAIREHETFLVRDFHAEERWPRFRERADELGIRSFMAFRLFVEQDTIGSLDLYATAPHAFDERATALGQVFAAHAAVALRASIEEAGLEDALRTRDVIGQAKGVLMERRRCTASEAFDMLRELSQRQNRKLHDVARGIAETGELPGTV